MSRFGGVDADPEPDEPRRRRGQPAPRLRRVARNSVGTPQDACRADWRPDVALLEWMEKRAPALRSRILLHHFFAWYIETHRSRHYDDGRSVQLPNVVNPLPLLQMEPPASETQRRALPSYRIRQLLDLLMKGRLGVAQDPGSRIRQRRRRGYGCRSPPSGRRCVRRRSRSCCCCRFEDFQVRALDSGEGDSEVYEDGVWKENTGPLAPVKGTRRKGFLRRYQSSAREWVGFYANTNKTSKLGGTWDKGYELPFEHALVQKIATDLLAWQKTFNPVAGPTSWSGFYGTMVRAIRRAPAFFLFRDPANPDPSVPPTYGCLKWLWDKHDDRTRNAVGHQGAQRGRFADRAHADGRALPVFELQPPFPARQPPDPVADARQGAFAHPESARGRAFIRPHDAALREDGPAGSGRSGGGRAYGSGVPAAGGVHSFASR